MLGALLGRRGGGIFGGGDDCGERGAAVPEFFTLNKLGNIEAQINAATTVNVQAVQNDGDKTRALMTAQYEATLNRLLSEATARQHATDIVINMSQSQSQQQSQGRINDLCNHVQALMNEQVRQGQVIYNTGLMAGSGTQSTTSSQVRL